MGATAESRDLVPPLPPPDASQGWHWWARTLIEAAIGVGTILTGVFALSISRNIASADDKDRDQQREDSIAAILESQAIAREEIRIDVLGTWLPEFVDGDDPLAAQRMIVALLPRGAKQAFDDLRTGYIASGLLSNELEQRLNDAIEGASRARASSAEFAVEIEAVGTADDAAELEQQLVDNGLQNVEVLERDDEFVVVVRDFDTEQAAETIRASIDDLAVSAEVVDLADSPASGPTVVVPDIYELDEATALQQLESAGFSDVVVWRVSSASVAAGLTRELVLNNGEPATNETEVVDENGVQVATLEADTPLAIKVSTGSA